MRHVVLSICLLGLASGCKQMTVYEIDFSSEPAFKWNGKVRITEGDARFRRVELGSESGAPASIILPKKGGRPKAMIGPHRFPDGAKLLGTRDAWMGQTNIVLIIEPGRVEAFAKWIKEQITKSKDEPLHRSELSDPWAKLLPFVTSIRTAPMHRKPYAKNAEKLATVDWWAIALQEAEEVTMRFVVPEENLEITMRGNPRLYGPAVMEVKTIDGKLLRRFEQQQVDVKKIEQEMFEEPAAPSTKYTPSSPTPESRQ